MLALHMSRTYSDVVASRPPSPRKEQSSSTSESSISDVDDSSVTYRLDRQNDISSNTDNRINVDTRTLETTQSVLERQNESTWTTVERRRAHSRSSSRQGDPLLTREQAQSIQMAMQGMTTEQRQTMQRRQEKTKLRRNSSLSSRGEGPSRPKGKTADFGNYGQLNFSQESLDIEAQAAALKSFKKASKHRSGHERKTSRTEKKRDTPNLSRTH